MRVAAALIAALAATALVAQFVVTRSLPAFDTTPRALWAMAGYFTVLTNLWVAGYLGRIALGAPHGPAGAGAVTLAIVGVGVLYHALLARLSTASGLAWWADQGLHTAVPLAVALWWLACVRKARWALLPVWLAWPAVYLAYALTRGALTGFWPYPFLDADTLGWRGVLTGVPGLLAAFAALGAGMVGIARLSR